MSAKHLVIGLDGAELSLLDQFGPQALPNLHALMARGAHAALRSVEPPATLPNWTTFLTGANPGRHGVFDFTTRQGYRVHFTAGSVREMPTLAAHLDRVGKACACLFFPATFPPERLTHGVFISGWDAPVAFEADASFVWPRAMHAQLTARFGPMRFDDVDEFDSERAGFHATLPDSLCARVERRLSMCRWLLDQRDWDLFAVYFGEGDTAAHHLWALHDPHSPRRPAHVSKTMAAGLRRVYEALDRAVGALVAKAGGPAVEVTIVSDHGFGGASDKVLYLNRALAEAGLLRFKRRDALTALVGRAKEVALTRLPPPMRERVFRLAGATLPGLLESRARFGHIDMAHTLAFSDELNYFPAVLLNVRGREPDGVVPPDEVPAVIERVREALSALRDPWSGKPVVAKVTPREQLFVGPYLERAPDLLLELHLDRGYSYNLMPSAGAPEGSGAFRRLGEDEYLGRKGRSLQGSHRAHGVWIASGPQVRAAGRVDAGIADATATLLARMGATLSEPLDGRVVGEVLRGRDQSGRGPQTHLRPLPAVGLHRDGRSAEAQRGDQARVEARLRKLGYIE